MAVPTALVGGVLHHVGHALVDPDPDPDGEMDNVGDAVECPFDGIGVAYVSHHQVDVRREVAGSAEVSVDLRVESVEDPYKSSRRDQAARHMSPDESSTAGNKRYLVMNSGPSREVARFQTTCPRRACEPHG